MLKMVNGRSNDWWKSPAMHGKTSAFCQYWLRIIEQASQVNNHPQVPMRMTYIWTCLKTLTKHHQTNVQEKQWWQIAELWGWWSVPAVNHCCFHSDCNGEITSCMVPGARKRCYPAGWSLSTDPVHGGVALGRPGHVNHQPNGTEHSLVWLSFIIIDPG